MVEISATQIRQRAGAGQPYRYFVLPQVFHLIEGFRLYHQPAFIPDENLES
jgi:nicotinic acid mononucleotide adenylyltransferase